MQARDQVINSERGRTCGYLGFSARNMRLAFCILSADSREQKNFKKGEGRVGGFSLDTIEV